MVEIFLTVATLVLIELGWLLALRLREEYAQIRRRNARNDEDVYPEDLR